MIINRFVIAVLPVGRKAQNCTHYLDILFRQFDTNPVKWGIVLNGSSD